MHNTLTVNWSGLWYILTQSVLTKCLFFLFFFVKKTKQIWSSRWGLGRVAEGKWSTNSICSLMPKAMPGCSWVQAGGRELPRTKPSSRGVKRGERGMNFFSLGAGVAKWLRNDFKESYLYMGGGGLVRVLGFAFFFHRIGFCFWKKALEMLWGKIYNVKTVKTHTNNQQGHFMILEVPDI